LSFTDADGHRFQVFITDQDDADVARLELRHRQRARAEDRIRAARRLYATKRGERPRSLAVR
jgi:hypothetical protein